nr:envelope protein {V1 region, clone A 1} [simian immunodeficiency virus SIV, smmPBj14, isolate PBj10bcl, Peptide Partial Mutant, 59 aa] [Simian immunodeficiency virus]
TMRCNKNETDKRWGLTGTPAPTTTPTTTTTQPSTTSTTPTSPITAKVVNDSDPCIRSNN